MVYKFFDKKFASLAHKSAEGSGNKSKCQINKLQMSFINQLLENLKVEGFMLHLKTIFGV